MDSTQVSPIGSRISHYRILNLLGTGGMGAVYRANDDRLDRDLALKVLLVETADDVTARARLVREARMASSLNHPHIAHVYEVGEDREHLFIAMELVEGRTLRASIPSGGWPPDTLLRHGLQIADALAYAHERGVIHRDLKSANIMLTSDGWVKVLDFGLAKRLPEKGPGKGPGKGRAGESPDLNLTASGIVLGTPNHLPPEVLRGEPADARSDIWAFGVVLYEMASGKLPFEGGSIGELSEAILNGAPSPLSGRVPIGIQAVIGRCLAKDPNQRYRQGNEVRAAIEALIGASSQKGAGGVSRRVWIPAAIIAAVVLAAAIAIGTGVVRNPLVKGGHRPRIGSLAVLPLANLSGDPEQEYFADGMTEELITDLASIQSLKVTSRTSIMRFKNSKATLREIASSLGVDAIVEGSVQRAGDRVRITAQLIEASSDRHLWARSVERDFQDVLSLQIRDPPPATRWLRSSARRTSGSGRRAMARDLRATPGRSAAAACAPWGPRGAARLPAGTGSSRTSPPQCTTRRRTPARPTLRPVPRARGHPAGPAAGCGRPPVSRPRARSARPPGTGPSRTAGRRPPRGAAARPGGRRPDRTRRIRPAVQ